MPHDETTIRNNVQETATTLMRRSAEISSRNLWSSDVIRIRKKKLGPKWNHGKIVISSRKNRTWYVGDGFIGDLSDG
jgi:hypothetical protein